MTADLYPLQVLLVTLAGWVNRHQQHVIEYLVDRGRSFRTLRDPVPFRREEGPLSLCLEIESQRGGS